MERALALAIFAASYVGLGLGRLPGVRVDRTGIAIIGGALMVLSGVLPWNDAVLAVDAHTLVLLFGMMIVVAYLRLGVPLTILTLLIGWLTLIAVPV
jgi:Na+/H+ antiporter NhaD/arsenite permease-like protein